MARYEETTRFWRGSQRMIRSPQLKLMDLVLGLGRFGDRYGAIGVFADDVMEVRSVEPVDGLRAIGPEEQRFRYTVPAGKPHAGESYEIGLFPEAGVVQMSRAGQVEPAPPELPPRAGLTGASALRAVNAAQRMRGEAAAEPIILGLLVGTTLNGSTRSKAARRVFTMQFEPSLGQWRAYDGGLVPWMKEHLLPTSA
jgi:hypothetical protein